MNLHHPEATHLIDGILPLKVNNRGIFRLDATGEWCRSNVAPEELKYIAKKVEDQHAPEEPKKPKRDQYLDTLNRIFCEVKAITAEQKKPTIKGMADKLNTSPLTIRRCLLMLKNNLTAEKAYDQLPAPSNTAFKAAH